MAFAWVLAMHGLTALIAYFFAKALGISITSVQMLIVVPVVAFFIMLPVTINGHGLRELLLIAYFQFGATAGANAAELWTVKPVRIKQPARRSAGRDPCRMRCFRISNPGREQRRQIAERYRAGIFYGELRLLSPKDGAEFAWHLFPGFTRKRNGLREHLNEAQIKSGLHYPRIIPDQKAMRVGGLTVLAVEPQSAQRLADQELSLPMHPFLRDDEVDRVIIACNNFAP